MKKKILITGSCGFIGSNLVNRLLHYNYDFVLIDDFSTGFKKNLLKIQQKAKNLNKKIYFYEINLINYKKLHSIFLTHKISVIFHLAAFSNVNESKKNPKKFLLNNVLSTENLLKESEFFKIKYFIFSSSAAVYGNNKFKKNIKEDFSLKPISVYGKSKKICENKIFSYSKNNNIKYCIFRYFNVIGRDIGNNLTKKKNLNLFEMIAFCKNKNKGIKIYGKKFKTHDGTAVRDFIFIDDLVEAHIVCLKKLNHKKFWNNVYNVGYNKGYSVLDVILECNRNFKNKIKYEFLKSRSGEISKSVANTEKFLNNSQWKPRMSNLKKIVTSFFQNT